MAKETFNIDFRTGSLIEKHSNSKGVNVGNQIKKQEKGLAYAARQSNSGQVTYPAADMTALNFGTGAFSLVCAFRMGKFIHIGSAFNTIFGGQFDVASKTDGVIALYNSSQILTFYWGAGGATFGGIALSDSGSLYDGKYHLAILDFDGTTYRAYLDNIKEGNESTDIFDINFNEFVVGRGEFTSRRSNSDIAYIRAYDTALTQAERNDLMTEFLHSHGTTEQKRNFVYPKATDLSSEVDSVVGEQLVVNGGFDTDTWWTKEDGWEIDNGVASYDGNTNAASLSQVDATLSSPMKDDTKYKLSFTISNASTHARLYILDASGGVVYVSSTIYQNGKHIIEFTSPSTTVSTGGGISFYAYDSGSSFDIDDITVQEVTGLVAAYNMIPSKGKLIDISGQGNNGTITGALSTKDGMAFDGVDDYVEVTSFTGIDTGTNNYSNSMRVNMKEIGKEQHLAEFSGTQVALNSANRLFMIGASNPLSSSSVTIPLGEHTFTFVVKNPGAAIYVDGNLYLENDDYTEAVTVETLTIGGYYGGGSYYFKGDIQDLKIYNYAFTPQQAKDYHNSFIKPTLIETFKDTGADGIVKTPKGWM